MILKSCIESYLITVIKKKNNDSLVRGLESYFITLIKKIKFLTVGVNGKMSQL